MILYKLDTEEENTIIMMRCNKNLYDITHRHHYQLESDKQQSPSDKPDTKRILRILTKHRSHQQPKNRLPI